ncbi:MAG: UV DNA damage repair endonuclease UvsE [Syntrophomonadaceae bacterium]|nr:UV DNA damage repair endonuclease UvsE [Syntrophomonadaceae bacterium]
MSIGYACLTVGVRNAEFKNCILKNATPKRLYELIGHNLIILDRIIDYNIANNIRLFRISSDLIPFGSSPVNQLPWHKDFSEQFHRIGTKIKSSGMRVSMHPGQYTVLNSPDEGVVRRAVEDLEYHERVLSSLDLDGTHKIVLHIGGVYNDKKASSARFIFHYEQLSERVKKRLVIENDDRSYNIADLLAISRAVNAPVIFDNLHHWINPADHETPEMDWIDECALTWKPEDGRQKIHYSQQEPSKKPGSHSETVRIREFMEFSHDLNGRCLDIMLEVKDKNLSALKCINCTSREPSIRVLEAEWSKYKYVVLERSPQDYQTIRELLKDKSGYPAVQFYELLEEVLLYPEMKGNAINAAQHVWAYFKDVASDKERAGFFGRIEKYQQSEISLKLLKNYLHQLAVKYQRDYLLDSYYFAF